MRPLIELFDWTRASESDFAALNAFSNRMRAEATPEYPPLTLQETQAQFQNIPDFVEIRMWLIWNETHDQIVGSCVCNVLNADHNQHIAQIELEVLPEARRQGLGSALLAKAVAMTEVTGRRLLIAQTQSNVPAGEAFMQRIGAEVGLKMGSNQLEIDSLDRALLNRWLAKSDALLESFEFGQWEGAYPEEDLATIAAMREVMNTTPLDDLEIEDMRWTPEQLRQMEAYFKQQGMERWTQYARHKASGKIAGYTEMFWKSTKPEYLNQGDTGVFPEFRGQGIGRYLKAKMMELMLERKPQAKYVRTGNAYSNAPMLKINEEMGFKPFRSTITWQIPLEKAQAFLSERH